MGGPGAWKLEVDDTVTVSVQVRNTDLAYADMVMVDPEQAHLLLRCVQEIITNSVRHAQAQNLWIRLSMAQDGVAMSARDDGRGVNSVQVGNGLRGMNERLTQLGGKLEVESQRGAGFTLHAWIPTEAKS